MEIREYQKLAMRTNDGKCNDRVLEHATKVISLEVGGHKREEITQILGSNPGELLNGALGLTGEAGEVADMIKKHIFHGHDLKRGELVKEIGDCAWYLALLCHAIDISLDEVLIANIEKLRNRYPEGFSSEASINRTE